MLGILLKKNLQELFRNYFYDARKGKKRSPVSVVLMFVLLGFLLVVSIGGMFFGMGTALAAPLNEAGMGWFYFMIFGGMGLLLGTIGSAFTTYTTLYLPKDNDLLLSMPIPHRTIIASRLLSVALMSFLFSAAAIVPGALAWWIFVAADPAHILGGIMLLLITGTLVVVLASLLGLGVAAVSRRLKNKSLVITILLIAFFILYYVAIFTLQEKISEFVMNVALYGEKIRGASFLLYSFGMTGTGALWHILGWTAVSLILLALTFTLLSRSFLSLTSSAGSVGKTVYREKPVRERSVSGALIAREMGRFFGSPMVTLNTGIASIMMLLAAGLLFWQGPALGEVLREVFAFDPGFISVILCGVICLAGAMNDYTVVSVSLEAKTLWISRTLPVETQRILHAKVVLQLIYTLPPALLLSVSVICMLQPALLEAILLILVPQIFLTLTACFGLFLDLKRPNLHWISEMLVVKQGLNVFLMILGAPAAAILLTALYLPLAGSIPAAAYMALTGLVYLILTVLLIRWLNRRGSALYESL
ncbi:MAG: hypothetical protein ILP12_01765 [Lachnospiraceae bacterium]|nr:hypothetical protein [Lachnospiraceae bacterium]